MLGLKDREAGQRIVSETGLDGIAVDPKRLASDLRLAWDLARNADLVASPAASKQMIRELGQFASAARRFKSRLDSLGKRAKLPVKQRLDDNHLEIADFSALLDALARDAEAVVGQANNKPDNHAELRWSEAGSTFERFVGGELAELYTRHFGLKPTFTRNAKRGVSGSFLSFCLAALSELEIRNNGRPYTAEAVARALTSARTAKLRPKQLGKGVRER